MPRTAADVLKEEIAATGPVTVARYMEIALGDAETGYYMTRDPFGTSGDFTTAPEVSQMFGELLGLWAAVVWQAMGAPERILLVEPGPGRGTMMADALRAGGQLAPFAAALDVHLVETSPVLRSSQEQMLAPYAQAGLGVSWHDTLDAVPAGPMIVLANEFFDALPIHQLHKTPMGWRERLVDVNAAGDGFRFVLADAAPDAALLPQGVDEASDGDVVEVAPIATDIMHKLAGRVVSSGGAVLAIDYGHAQNGIGETLQAVKDHAYHDTLKDIGAADLTAHVDFLSLAEAARRTGADVHGPVPQGAFLERLGLSERKEALLANATPEQFSEIQAGCHRLTGADGMGLLFKVLAVTQPGLRVPPWG